MSTDASVNPPFPKVYKRDLTTQGQNQHNLCLKKPIAAVNLLNVNLHSIYYACLFPHCQYWLGEQEMTPSQNWEPIKEEPKLYLEFKIVKIMYHVIKIKTWIQGLLTTDQSNHTNKYYAINIAQAQIVHSKLKS